jgi:hypothetical protein
MVERGDLERPGGRRFGALVHALLASIDLSADARAVQAVASVQGRIVGATDEEIFAAIATIGRVLKHPILRRAASAGRTMPRFEHEGISRAVIRVGDLHQIIVLRDAHDDVAFVRRERIASPQQVKGRRQQPPIGPPAPSAGNYHKT